MNDFDFKLAIEALIFTNKYTNSNFPFWKLIVEFPGLKTGII